MWGRHPVFTMHSFGLISFSPNSFSCLSGDGRRADQVECCSSKWFSLIPMRIAREGEEKRPRAMPLSVKAMVATAASHPKMWGRQKCGDVDRLTQNVGTSTGVRKRWGRRQDVGTSPEMENVGTSPGFRRRPHIFGPVPQRRSRRKGGGAYGHRSMRIAHTHSVCIM